MNISVTLTAAILLLAMTGLANAGTTLASPAIYGGTGEFYATCAIRNVGRTTLTSVDVSIRDESGNVIAPNVQHCNGVGQTVGSPCHLLPGGIFWIDAGITDGFAYACSAAGSARTLHGVVIVGGSGLRSAPLR